MPGELVADCFELAVEVRELDMRASPYDLRALGYQPVPVETPAGKAEYAAAQRRFAERGAVLRARLVGVCDRLLDAADPPDPGSAPGLGPEGPGSARGTWFGVDGEPGPLTVR